MSDPMDSFRASVQRVRELEARQSAEETDTRSAGSISEEVHEDANLRHDSKGGEATPSSLYGEPSPEDEAREAVRGRSGSDGLGDCQTDNTDFVSRAEQGSGDESDEDASVERTREELLRQLAALPTKASKKGREKETSAREADANARARLETLCENMRLSQAEVQDATRLVAEARASLEQRRLELEKKAKHHRDNKEALDAALGSSK